MPHMVMVHEKDPRNILLDAVGNVDDVDLFHNQVLLAIYERPEKTTTGIILPDQHRDEDKYQGKVCMIVKKGPTAFEPDGKWFDGSENFQEGDWVVIRPADGWACSINKKLCRIVDDINIRMRISSPDVVY